MTIPPDREIQQIKLSDLANKIRKTIVDAFSGQTFWVVAEISGHKYYANNDWHYFTLVEKIENSEVAVAKIKCKSWSAGSFNIKKFENVTGQRFTDGIQVLVKVEVEYHIVHELSLTLLDIDIAFTLGTLEKQRQATLAKLVAENPEFIQLVSGEYITRNKQLILNRVIQHIAIIGSEKSKGMTDFQHTIFGNAFHYKFVIDYYHTTVRGADAERQLVNALIAVHGSKKQYDAVVILRGGGAKTDFLVFDTYKLARAIAKFPVPIITGIGHHEDVSIADLMAHSHKIVPTKAAEFIIAHNRTFEEQLLQLQKITIINSQKAFARVLQTLNFCNSSIINNSRSLLAGHKEGLNTYYQITANNSKSLLYNYKNDLFSILNALTSNPKIIVSNRKETLSNLINNIDSYSKTFFKTNKSNLQHFSSIIKMMSPVNIMKKGFALIYNNDKIAVNSASIHAGSEIRIRMHDSQLISTVKEKVKIDGNTDL